MGVNTSSYPTLATSLLEGESRIVRNIALILAGTMLLYLSAKLKIPLDPVPISMQTFIVLTLGMVYGWKLGSLTMIAYIFEGMLGLPVFAGTPEKGIGLAYIVGPTGGYLVGFVIAAGVVGYFAERGWDRNIFMSAITMIIGNVVIYICGLIWLAKLLNFKLAIKFGLLPFIAGDLFKIFLAALLLPLCWKLLGRRS